MAIHAIPFLVTSEYALHSGPLSKVPNLHRAVIDIIRPLKLLSKMQLIDR
jgi:hypothetical protein